MHILYDTGDVPALDRYEYYRTGATAEVAPVEIRGRSSVSLTAAMSVAQIGRFEIEATSWICDTEGVALRTKKMIRTSDPECYRICVPISGELWVEQNGSRGRLRPRDIGLYDTSREWDARHVPGRTPLRLAMVTVPRTLVPLRETAVRPIVGMTIPRRMPGRDLVAAFLTGIAQDADPATNPELGEALSECVTGILRQRIDERYGISPGTRRLLLRSHVRAVIRRHLADPFLDVDRIARAVGISPRYLFKVFEDAETTPMQLVKRLRLEECRRSLQNPALLSTTVNDIVFAHGYARPDQFARDFRQLFGMSATETRQSVRRRPAGDRERP
ncbi:helix-turn-helix domain-containing protein [Solwaraspora sp. WMMD406]|uniref:helix-turn-helix domain-containing protein n=1 Tax=Solwaraspora sp. WMMD406 TaxID=3016095 RepID=UPI0024161C66|nr:helix-turn-helix domain-containing protein [Solwaraspora sp. WMMD406]MDG4765905.1 helix-turn-helix domain-containing protein [Solwaraspora sp. WMMD406]